jgi:hypothetical protein
MLVSVQIKNKWIMKRKIDGWMDGGWLSVA